MEEESREKSEFNMAVSYLNRLNQLAYVCNLASMELDAQTWFHGILNTYKETTIQMKEKEEQIARDWIKKIQPMMKQYLDKLNKKGVSEINYDLYMELLEFEIFLKKIQKDAGLITKIKDDPKFALGN